MSLCKTCNKIYYHCNAIGVDLYANLGYCSQICYEKSDEFVKMKDIVITFIESLDLDQLNVLSFILENKMITEYYINAWVSKNILK